MLTNLKTQVTDLILCAASVCLWLHFLFCGLIQTALSPDPYLIFFSLLSSTVLLSSPKFLFAKPQNNWGKEDSLEVLYLKIPAQSKANFEAGSNFKGRLSCLQPYPVRFWVPAKRFLAIPINIFIPIIFVLFNSTAKNEHKGTTCSRITSSSLAPEIQCLMPYLHASSLQKSWCPCASCGRLFYIRISKDATDWAELKGSICRAGGAGSHVLRLQPGDLQTSSHTCLSPPAQLLVAFHAQLSPAASHNCSEHPRTADNQLSSFPSLTAHGTILKIPQSSIICRQTMWPVTNTYIHLHKTKESLVHLCHAHDPLLRNFHSKTNKPLLHFLYYMCVHTEE